MNGESTGLAWRRLGFAMRPRWAKSQLMVAGLTLLLGFAVVTQVRSTWGSDYSSLRQNELVEVLDQLSSRAEQLRQENSELAQQLQTLRDAADSGAAAKAAAAQQAQVEGILAGTVPAQGPGVEVQVTDASGRLDPALMAALVDELRNAGAEAIEVGGVRITVQSYFGPSRDGQMTVDGTTLTSPFTWLAIGDPETLQAALSIPGGALAAIRAARSEATVTTKQSVLVDAVRAAPSPTFATAIE